MLRRLLTTSLIAGAVVATGAHAADMPALFPQSSYEEDAIPPQRIEFGTGWYLRGDLSASYDDELAYSSSYLGALASTPNTAAAYAASGGAILATRQDWGYAAGAGVGYKFNAWFRADITGDYLSTQQFNADAQSADGTFAIAGKGTIRRWDGLVNGYVDLGNWSGFQPYVGAGVGFVSYKSKGSADVTFGALSTTYQANNDSKYELAWAAMAGIGYQVGPHTLLDVGYRYLDLGTYRVPGTGEAKNFSSHQARVGIRYVID